MSKATDPAPRGGPHTPLSQDRACCASQLSVSPARRQPSGFRAHLSRPALLGTWGAGGRGRKPLHSGGGWEGGPLARQGSVGQFQRGLQGRSRRTKGGGRTRHVCGPVCDSIPVTRRFKGRTASVARKRKHLGAGRPACFCPAPRSALPCSCGWRRGASLEPGTLAPHSNFPARSALACPRPPALAARCRAGARCRKWIPAGAAAAARRRAPGRLGGRSRGSALRLGAHERADRARPRAQRPSLCPRATVRHHGLADIGSATR